MGIDNIPNNNSINISFIEQNKDLSNKEKESLLSIFNTIDSQEDDNQKGILTTFDAINEFLESSKNIIGKKYNKFLDSVNLSFLKNDKNTNGLIDKEDFSPEQWEKITGFAPFMKDGAKWTEDIEILFQRIFNKTENTNNLQKEVIVEGKWATYAILYDDKTRTVKSVMFNETHGYCASYFECKLDENSDVIKEIEVTDDGHYTTPEGEYVKISYQLFNDFVTSRGFKPMKESHYTQEEIEHRIELWKKSGAWDEK